ncbi:hypothetical protein BU23DRAFT_461081, partial [Bimuria novae-zelandiae CBS 107.79]
LNHDIFGIAKAPRTVRLRRPLALVTTYKQALFNFLNNKPIAYLNEMQDFLYDKFNI